MTGKDDDYNFVFKGKLGILQREGSREGGREAVSKGDGVFLCFISYLDPPSQLSIPSRRESRAQEYRQEWLQVQMFGSCIVSNKCSSSWEYQPVKPKRWKSDFRKDLHSGQREKKANLRGRKSVRAVVVHVFNPSLGRQRQADF